MDMSHIISHIDSITASKTSFNETDDSQRQVTLISSLHWSERISLWRSPKLRNLNAIGSRESGATSKSGTLAQVKLPTATCFRQTWPS